MLGHWASPFQFHPNGAPGAAFLSDCPGFCRAAGSISLYFCLLFPYRIPCVS